jgi:cytochrome P450 family 4
MFITYFDENFLKGNGVTIPKGCNIAMAFFSLHQRQDIWGANADLFKPERFAPEHHRHPYSFLPFSGGSRICIGYKYASISMKIALTYLLRRYQFSTKLKIDELKWCFGITQRLENKHMVTATRRVWT